MRLSHVLMGPSFIPSDVSMETVYDAATDGIQSVVAIETMSTIKTNAVHVREGQENIQVGRIEGEEEREREREKCMVDEGVGMLEDQKEVAIQKAMATQLDLNGHGNVIVHTEVFTANAEKGMKSKVDISDVQVERVEKEMEKEKDKEKDHEKDKPLHTIDTPRRTSSSRIDPPRVAIKGGIHSSMLNGKIEETKPPTHPLTPLELQREHERKVNEFWCSRHQLKHMLDQKVHHAGRITGLLAQERQRLMELQQQKESMSGVLAPKHQQELDELSMRVANEQAEYLQAEKDFATVHAGYYHSMHPSASSMIDALLTLEKMNVRQYQRYYKLEGVVHLETKSSTNQPVLTFKQCLMEAGNVLPVILPPSPFQVPYNLSYFASVATESAAPALRWQKKPIPNLFQDEHAIRLAIQTGAHIVTSSSGLQALLDTSPTLTSAVPRFNSQWEVPVKVVEVGGQRIVVMGRPLIKKKVTQKHRNTRFYAKAFESGILDIKGSCLNLQPTHQLNPSIPTPNKEKLPPVPCKLHDKTPLGIEATTSSYSMIGGESEQGEISETTTVQSVNDLKSMEIQLPEGKGDNDVLCGPLEFKEKPIKNKDREDTQPTINQSEKDTELLDKNHKGDIGTDDISDTQPPINVELSTVNVPIEEPIVARPISIGGKVLDTPGENVTYTLWTLGDLKVLVRCRVHGYFQDPVLGYVRTGMKVKCEYMPRENSVIGPEVPAPGERARWWLYTLLRSQPEKESHLFIGRVNMLNLDIQWEHMTLRSIYGRPTPDPEVLPLFTNMQNIFRQLQSYQPGNYLVGHDFGDATVKVYRAVDDPSQFGLAYDLYAAQDKAGVIDTNHIPWLHSKGPSYLFPLPLRLSREDQSRLTIILKSKPRLPCCYAFARQQRCTSIPCPYEHIAAQEIFKRYGKSSDNRNDSNPGEVEGKRKRKKKGKGKGKRKRRGQGNIVGVVG